MSKIPVSHCRTEAREVKTIYVPRPDVPKRIFLYNEVGLYYSVENPNYEEQVREREARPAFAPVPDWGARAYDDRYSDSYSDSWTYYAHVGGVCFPVSGSGSGRQNGSAYDGPAWFESTSCALLLADGTRRAIMSHRTGDGEFSPAYGDAETARRIDEWIASNVDLS